MESTNVIISLLDESIVTSIWSLHDRSQKGLPDKDFKSLNKLSVKEKATCARTQYTFRQNVDVRLREPVKDKGIYLPEEEFTYGRGNRPSTPMKAVMSGFYGDVAEQQTLNRYEVLKEQSKPISLAQARNHTKASQLAQTHIKLSSEEEKMRQSKTLFKMKKFQQVTARTNTHNPMRRHGS